MKAGVRILITVVILLALIGGFYIITSSITSLTGYSVRGYSEDEIKNFTECLAEKGVILYVYGNSKLCEEQKEIFGEAFNQLSVVNCLEEIETCAEKEIKFVGRPAWEIRKTIYYGPFELDKISKISGCEIKLKNG